MQKDLRVNPTKLCFSLFSDFQCYIKVFVTNGKTIKKSGKICVRGKIIFGRFGYRVKSSN